LFLPVSSVFTEGIAASVVTLVFTVALVTLTGRDVGAGEGVRDSVSTITNEVYVGEGVAAGVLPVMVHPEQRRADMRMMNTMPLMPDTLFLWVEMV